MATENEIQHHYDVSNEFYQQWLDDSMTYSCAIFEGKNRSLEEAQEAKLKLALRETRAKPGERVLDVGCGWGSMLSTFLGAGIHGEGITLSAAQAEFCQSLGHKVHLMSWADFRTPMPFDGMVSIGAFEHFSDIASPSDQLKTYKKFFRWAASVLRPEAGFFLQSITREPHFAPNFPREDILFVAQKIFPGSLLPRLGQITTAASAYFEVKEIWSRRLDYSRTCAEWLARLRINREACLRVSSPEVVAAYERYLDISVRSFAQRGAFLYQVSMTRV